MITLGPVLPPKPKPKPKPKPHKLFDSEDILYSDWESNFANFGTEQIEVYGYIYNEGFAVPEDGTYVLESGNELTLTNGIVTAFS